MEYKHFISLLESAGVDIWTFIDTAIGVAIADHADELKQRRDGIVESLYSVSSLKNLRRCPNCDDPDDDDNVNVVVADAGVGDNRNGHVVVATVKYASDDDEEKAGDVSPYTPQSVHLDNNNKYGDRDMRFGDLFDDDGDDDEQNRILNIRDQLEDPEQSEESIVDLLQTLADMDLTFKALEETDIGRHVNRLRKHPSNKVRRLVKQQVSIWKETVDEWVRLNKPGGGQASSSAAFLDEDSPQQKQSQNGHHQVSDIAYSPNPHNGNSGSDKNNREQEPKRNAIANQETLTKSNKFSKVPVYAPPNRIKEQKETIADAQRFSSARKRLQDNYKEAENAKKQRTIQVMEVHEIPKKKNTFFPRNKGSSHGRHR